MQISRKVLCTTCMDHVDPSERPCTLGLPGPGQPATAEDCLKHREREKLMRSDRERPTYGSDTPWLLIWGSFGLFAYWVISSGLMEMAS